MKIRNTTRRRVTLPHRTHGEDGFRMALDAGEALPAPAWYLAELLDEPGPAALLSLGRLEVLEDEDAASPAPAPAPSVSATVELLADDGAPALTRAAVAELTRDELRAELRSRAEALEALGVTVDLRSGDEVLRAALSEALEVEASEG